MNLSVGGVTVLTAKNIVFSYNPPQRLDYGLKRLLIKLNDSFHLGTFLSIDFSKMEG